jgi:hypothetical protein
MAGKLFVDTIDTDNAFITLNVQQSLIATMNVSGIFSNTGVKMIGANGAVSNTAITGLVTAAQIATVANTQITGNITSSQITSNPTFYGNVSVTGAIGVGGATPTSNGSGITFPATQSASSDANTLDDYEEGTWTPSLGGTATYTTRLASYVKVGRLVTVFCYISVNSIGTGSAIQISGLPFSVSSDIGAGSGAISYLASIATSVVFITAYGNSGLPTTVQFRTLTAAGATAGNASIFQNSAIVEFTMTYVT